MQFSKILVEYLRPVEIKEDFQRKIFLFLFILTFSNIVSYQAWQTLYTNYVVEILELNAAQNGIAQSVRELPGLFAISVLLWLRFFREESMAVISILFLGVGVMLTGMFQSYTGILLTTFCMSLGFHYFETINQSILLQSFNTKVAPIVYGRLRSISALGTIFVSLLLLYFVTKLDYLHIYFLTGFIGIIGATLALLKKPDLSCLPTVQKKKLVFKSKYWLFYALTFLSGGRRQIFTIFSLFLLVEKFGFSASMVTFLFLVNNTINFFLNPLIGKLINVLGEKKLLTLQFAPAIFIFLGYAFLENPYIVAFLYILDQFTFSFNIAEKTFFQKMGDPDDISPSMAMSFTINHIAAVVVPTIGGALWLIDYKIPFFIGAGLAVTSLFLVQFIDSEIAKAHARKEVVIH